MIREQGFWMQVLAQLLLIVSIFKNTPPKKCDLHSKVTYMLFFRPHGPFLTGAIYTLKQFIVRKIRKSTLFKIYSDPVNRVRKTAHLFVIGIMERIQLPELCDLICCLLFEKKASVSIRPWCRKWDRCGGTVTLFSVTINISKRNVLQEAKTSDFCPLAVSTFFFFFLQRRISIVWSR